MEKALSNVDILTALNYECNLMRYSDMYKCKNIYDVLGPHYACIILYERKPHFGHWVCCFLVNKNRIEFFDSYGIFIDNELDQIDEKFKKEKNMTVRHLSKLIKKSTIPEIEYNQYQLQKYSNKINTCGRHCIVRLWNRHLKLDDYVKEIIKTNINSDILVTKLTKKI